MSATVLTYQWSTVCFAWHALKGAAANKRIRKETLCVNQMVSGKRTRNAAPLRLGGGPLQIKYKIGGLRA